MTKTMIVTRETAPFTAIYHDRSLHDTYKVVVLPGTLQNRMVDVTDAMGTFRVDSFYLYDYGRSFVWSC
jgi:hypothetical protein